MPSNNSVWVEHWNELEHKHVSQCMSTGVISSQNKVEETIKHKGRGGLPGVHSTTEKKHLQTHTRPKAQHRCFDIIRQFHMSTPPH